MAANTILVVDDREENLALMAQIVAAHIPECRYRAASSGPEALALAEAEPPDVVLLDVQMPEMDGLEVCRRLKASDATRDVPVILITGHRSSPELRVKGLEAGADDFITRPVGVAELRARVTVALRIKRSEDELRRVNRELKREVRVRTLALQASESLLLGVMDGLQLGICVVSSERRVLSANRQLDTWFPGFLDRRQPVCQTLCGRAQCGECDVHCPIEASSSEGGVQERVFEAPPIAPDRTFRVLSTPLRGAEDRLSGTVQVAEDVTEAYAARRAVEQERDRAQTYLDTAEVMLVSTDTGGVVQLVNRKACDTLGYAEGELNGRDWIETCVPEDHRVAERAAFERFASGHSDEDRFGESPVVGRGGEERLVQWRRSLLRDAGGRVTGVLASGEDVTEVRTLERLLLETSERERRRMARDLHDGVGQRLVATRLLASMLADDLLQAGSPAAADAERLAEEADRTLAEVRAVVRGLRPVSVGAEGLPDALRQLADVAEHLLDVACALETPEAIPGLDDAGADHLYRIAQEAVSNAARHGRASAVRLRLEVDEGTLRLAIEDDGVGFAPEASQAASGGMGLRIMSYRADAIGGTLHVEPGEGGRGTVVTCVAPLRRGA